MAERAGTCRGKSAAEHLLTLVWVTPCCAGIVFGLGGCAGGAGGGTVALTSPTAVATVTSSGTVGAPVTLDASQSNGPNGPIVRFLWAQTVGPDTVPIDNATGAIASFTPPLPGVYTLTLTVTDAAGASGSSTVSVEVGTSTGATTPGGVTAQAGPSQTVPAGTTVTLNGSASTGSGGQIGSFLWEQVSGPAFATILNARSPVAMVTLNAAGTYVFRLTVQAASGAISTATTTVTVASGSAPAL